MISYPTLYDDKLFYTYRYTAGADPYYVYWIK